MNLVNFNGAISDFAEATIRAVSSAALYGKSVFTTLAIYGGKPFLLREHLERLKRHGAKIGFDFSEFDFAKLQNALFETISANQITDGRARISVFDEAASVPWQFDDDTQKLSFLIILGTRRKIDTANFTLGVSPFPVNSKSPLSGIKSGNYTENLLAFAEARKRNFAEAVRLNERGEIVSACLANIFWIKGEKVFTPALETGALDGTTRDFVLQTANKNGFQTAEVGANLEEIKKADVIFLTSAAIEAVKIVKFENKNFGAAEMFEFLSAKFKFGVEE